MPKQILVRAVGPALANFGVAGVLTDPALAIFNAAGQQMFANDDWGTSDSRADLRTGTTSVGAFALTEGSKDSALLLTLDPGSYSAQVTGTAAPPHQPAGNQRRAVVAVAVTADTVMGQ